MLLQLAIKDALAGGSLYAVGAGSLFTWRLAIKAALAVVPYTM